MHVVVVGSKAFDSLEYHLADSLRMLAHTSIILDVTDIMPVPAKINYWGSRFVERYDRMVSQRLANKIVSLGPDLVLVVYRHLHPILVERVKQQLPGTPVVQINPDHLSNLEKQQIIAADFDCYFSKEPYIVDFLRNKAGLNAHYLAEGFNPRVHQKPTVEKFVAEWLTNIDVLIFGNLYAYRARMVDQLIRAGVNVAVYGTQGPYLIPAVRSAFRKQYLVGEAKNRLLYGAKIVFNNFHYAEVTSVNQKYFEVNGIGAFQLSDYKATVDEYTGVPSEQVTYRTLPEAIDKIRYYLAHSSERHELAQQQYQHFQQQHTFDRRVETLLRTVGLSESSVYEEWDA
ncbi:CgeB family protein [Spirosoma sp.]|uniref:CgeB family protein n=1 Tax=Spirosoma sp. TaxID=1899569 RepID=UPI003B3A8BCA